MLEDSKFEQGLEMLTVALAFSYIILLRIAGAPWTQLPTSLHSFFRVPLSELDDFQTVFQVEVLGFRVTRMVPVSC